MYVFVIIGMQAVLRELAAERDPAGNTNCYSCYYSSVVVRVICLLLVSMCIVCVYICIYIYIYIYTYICI